jgi:hypothetical protein
MTLLSVILATAGIHDFAGMPHFAAVRANAAIHAVGDGFLPTQE